MYLLKQPHNKGDAIISLYNHLMDTKNYNSLLGSTFYGTNDLSDKIGLTYNVSFTNAGILLKTRKTGETRRTRRST